MKTKLLLAGLAVVGAASLSGCVVAPAYDGPGYYGPAVVVAPPPVVYRGYYGGYGYRGGYYRYRRW